jgi:FAD-linked oxidoreductase
MSRSAALHPGKWRNWSGSVRATPREICLPGSIDELAQRVGAYANAGRRMRVVGAGHSFTPLAQSHDVLISLDRMQGIMAVDAAQGTVTVLGGTRLYALGAALHARGLAQENLGDINQQSIAGAISTSTHGTGVGFGSIATQVTSITLVTASGEIVACSATDKPDLFKAAQVALGALGVIAAVTLRVVPAKRLRMQTQREKLAHCLEHLETYKRDNAHFEYYWFPYTDGGQAKFLNETAAPATKGNLGATLNKIVLENGALWALSATTRLFPRLTPIINQIEVAGVTNTDEVNYSYRLYATPRAVKFQEMEYSIPQEHFPAALDEIRARIAKARYHVNFPIECRFARGDDIWLSTAAGRDSAYIAVHMYRGMPYQEYFQGIEAIFTRYEGRPHWGKIHTRDAAYLAAHYPHWQDFQQVRASLDPQGVFLNDYLRQLFAVSTDETGG